MPVFTDDFTAGTREVLEDYDSGSYRLLDGSGDDPGIYVDDSNNRAERDPGGFGVSRWGSYRIIASGVPTGDQAIEADVHKAQTMDQGGLMLKCPTDDADSGYVFNLHNNPRIIRRVAGVDTVLVTGTESTPNGTYALRCEAVVNGSSVDLSFAVDTDDPVTFSDSSGDRIETGTPGLMLHHRGDETASPHWVDDLEVYDLDEGGGGSTAVPVFAHHYRQMTGG